MRLPSFELDFFELRSGEESRRKNPESFWIPDEAKRKSLKRGDAAKVILDIEGYEEDGRVTVQGERVWVIIAEQVGDAYIGILDSQPALLEPSDEAYLVFGAEIPLRPEHVIDIARPPEDYVEWQLGQKPERHWPRDGSRPARG